MQEEPFELSLQGQTGSSRQPPGSWMKGTAGPGEAVLRPGEGTRGLRASWLPRQAHLPCERGLLMAGVPAKAQEDPASGGRGQRLWHHPPHQENHPTATHVLPGQVAFCPQPLDYQDCVEWRGLGSLAEGRWSTSRTGEGAWGRECRECFPAFPGKHWHLTGLWRKYQD